MNNWPSWATSRPTSTGEYVTASGSSDMPSSFPRSEMGSPQLGTYISEPKYQQPTETIRDQIENLELSKNELKSENRKLEFEIERIQEKLVILTTELGASESSRIRLENKLINCYSRIDQLETDNRQFEIRENNYQKELQEKQALLETYQNQNELIECKLLGLLYEF